tara:strand:- start:12214 stop:12789 length:576 start_codon:yes stop_codon:yes gene_type:complete
MDHKTIIEAVEELFESECVSLFKSMNCSPTRIYIEDPELINLLNKSPLAAIDAGSNEIEFNIAIQVPMTVLAMTYPLLGEIVLQENSLSSVNDERLEDWISEISNQLIGRLKTKLTQRNCQISLGLPSTYFGIDANNVLADDGKKITIYFDLDGVICACHISIEFFSDNIEFDEFNDDNIDILPEGEIELF